MQGRPGQDPGKEPRDWSTTQEHAAVNGTGKQRAIPRRPPGMPHLDQPPTITRIARPERQKPSPKRRRRLFLIWGVIFLVGGVLAYAIGYAAVSFSNATSGASGSATAAADFLAAISSQNYDEAYKDLGANITVTMTQQEFTQLAQNDDSCFGPVTNYTEVTGSATIQGNPPNQSYSYSYTITRAKLKQPYQLRLTLQPDPDSTGSWVVTSYGNDLGPQSPTC